MHISVVQFIIMFNCPSTRAIHNCIVNVCWFISGLWILKWISSNICLYRRLNTENRELCTDLSDLSIGSGPGYGVLVVDEANKFIPQIKHLRFPEICVEADILASYAHIKRDFDFVHMFPVRYWYGMEGEAVVHCMGLYSIDDRNHNEWKCNTHHIYASPHWFKKEYALIYVVYANQTESVDYLTQVYQTLSLKTRCLECILLIWNPQKAVLNETFRNKLEQFTGRYSWWDRITHFQSITIHDKKSCENALEMYVRCLFNELNNSDA
eukprot:893268_1